MWIAENNFSRPRMTPMDYVAETRQWLERFVIGLNLCPFAATPLRKGQVRFVVEMGNTEDALIRTLLQELAYLLDAPAAEVETSLIIHPNVLQDFADYNDFLGLADELLEEAGLDGILQIASFHPDYQFADVPADDPANYSNRAPFPLLHLLREDSLSFAIDHYPNPERIPEINIERLRAMGEQEIRRLIGR